MSKTFCVINDSRSKQQYSLLYFFHLRIKHLIYVLYKLNPINTYSKINKHFMVMTVKQQLFTVAF